MMEVERIEARSMENRRIDATRTIRPNMFTSTNFANICSIKFVKGNSRISIKFPQFSAQTPREPARVAAGILSPFSRPAHTIIWMRAATSRVVKQSPQTFLGSCKPVRSPFLVFLVSQHLKPINARLTAFGGVLGAF